MERQLTFIACGHILTHAHVWSADGRWIVYDIRSDTAGSLFDGVRIERVAVATGKIQTLYQSRNGAHCGVVTCSPADSRIAFILGPEHPTADWGYAPWHRRGLIVDADEPSRVSNVDACDITPPFTPGALRGGSHIHIFDGLGKWISFTYEDALLSRWDRETSEQDMNLRGIGVSVPGHRVTVHGESTRNYGADYFSVLVTKLIADPEPGSNQIKKASEEAWVGANGYLKTDGLHQKHAIAFQGQVATASGQTISEVFIVDIPEDVTIPGDGPLEGTISRRPFPPRGCVQRRLTNTSHRKYPGLQGPRHWTISSSDGSRIAFLMRDDAGIVQIYSVSPHGGSITQLTDNRCDVASAFCWSSDGKQIGYVMDNSVFVTDIKTGIARRLTPRSSDAESPRPEACVFSPGGDSIAYVRPTLIAGEWYNQIFVTDTQR